MKALIRALANKKQIQLIKNIKKVIATSKTFMHFTEPLIKDGSVRECYENARREYWARKERGENPEYWIGTVYGYFQEDDPSKKAFPLHHAWVVVNGLISDPTPFKYGIGNFIDLPERLAKQHWKKAEYRGQAVIPESKLENKLDYFPTVS